MKKIILLFCAAAMLSMTGCKKDDPTPDNNGNNTPTPVTPSNNNSNGSGDQQNQVPNEVDRAGLYAPGRQMATISVDDTLSEQWVWENGQLKKVKDALGREKVSFTYRSDGRMETMTVNAGDMLSGTVSLTYDGEKVKQLTLNGESALTAEIENNENNKVKKATIKNIEDDGTLLSMFNSAVSMFLGSTDSTGIVSGIDSVSGSITFNWNGINVRSSSLAIGARLHTTIGQVAALLNNDFSMFGDYSNYAQQVAQTNPNMPLYIKVLMHDEATYTYDSYTNPFRHYLGSLVTIEENMPRFNISALSTNNVKNETHSFSADINVYTIVDMVFTTVTYPLYNNSMSLYSTEKGYEYTYRPDKYPSGVNDSDGIIKSYTYQQ